MSKKSISSNIEPVERRHAWQDRRSGTDRRNPQRLRLVTYDCRTSQPRRKSDLSGELADGDVWWKEPSDAGSSDSH
jgi:hypothetical protein